MPNAQCPNAQCPMPNAPCPMPNAQFLKNYEIHLDKNLTMV
ncbi:MULTISPECIES: hypothetical protein [unclassified Calothrix]|nr:MULTISPECIES: hypothetical protein [unclassified Calothrix]